MVDDQGRASEQPNEQTVPPPAAPSGSAQSAGSPEQSSGRTTSQLGYGDRVLAACGYLLVGASVLSFGVITVLKLLESLNPPNGKRYESWFDLVQHESSTLSLLVIGVVAATLGKRLLTTVRRAGVQTIPVRRAGAQTIPEQDLPLIRQAVIDGKSEPIDQYVRLRSLSGMSGNFTKLGITGLPLTTVSLTLVFSLISLIPTQLMPAERANSFLDLAKLTLGAFIGSFVQRQVEQRRQESAQAQGTSPTRPSLPA